MFSGISRMLGIINVKEGPKTITVEGLPGNTFGKDVAKTWSTSKIANYMLNQITTSKISFNKFFAIDVVYMLEALRKAPVAYGVNRRALKKTIDALYEDTWLGDLDSNMRNILDMSQLSQFKKKPLDHQTKFFEAYNANVPRYHLNGYLLAAKPGAGKTLSGLMLAACLGADVVVVISPNNAVQKVWGKTIREEYNQEQDPWISSEGLPMERGHKFYVFHYEALNRLADLQSMITGKNVVVIIDESHNFNEIKSARTNFVVDFCQRIRCQHVLWSSGTPVKALGYEMIPFLRTVDPFFDNDSEERFRKIFGKSSSKAVDILRNRIGLVSFKVEKSEFTKQKPIEHQVPVKVKDAARFTLDTIRKDMAAYIEERFKYYDENRKTYQGYYQTGLSMYEKTIRTPEQRKAFDTYRKYIAIIVKGYDPVAMKTEALYCNQFELGTIVPVLGQPYKNQFKSARSVIKYLNLKIAGEALGRVLGSRRTECNVALIQGAGLPGIVDAAEKKTIIFTSFVDVAEQTKKYMESHGYKPAIVYGDTNKNLSAIIDAFAKDPDCNPLIATFQSLSTAVPLTMADYVVLMNQPYRDFEREQAISRADRIGQDSQVNVFNVLLDTGGVPNISTRAADIVQWSREQVSAIMGTPVPETTVSLEEYYEAIEGMEPKGLVVTTTQRPNSSRW